MTGDSSRAIAATATSFGGPDDALTNVEAPCDTTATSQGRVDQVARPLATSQSAGRGCSAIHGRCLPSGKRPKARVWTTRAVARWRATGQRPSAVMVWTPGQAGAFLDHVERADPQLYPMFVLILHRGLRRGEACGIGRGVDIDL